MDIIKYNNEDSMTTSTHIFIAIAATTFAWVLVVKPFTTVMPKLGPKGKYSLIFFAFILYCIILPSIFIGNEMHKYIKSNFILLKLISVIIGYVFILTIIIYHDYSGNKNYKYSTILIYIILILNILEAVYSQFKFQEHSSMKNINGLNIINSVVGIILIIIIIIDFVKGNRISTVSNSNTLMLKSSLSNYFIILYTLWNLLFVIELNTTNSVLMFFLMTLLLPIVSHYLGIGDWLQVRSITLLFFMLLTYGLGTDKLNIFPTYNTIEEDINTIELNDINIMTRSYNFRLGLLIITCIIAFITLCKYFITLFK